MNPETFAAGRRESLVVADDAIRPAVEDALRIRPASRWYEGIVDASAQVWLENMQAEAPGANYAPALARFREYMEDSLKKTADNTNVDRVTRWAATLSVNAGTVQGAAASKVAYKRWVTMGDAKVRDLHEDMDGVIVPMGGVFTVAGNKLPWPGAPVGPPEVWIECRCVVQPAARDGEAMSASAFTIGPDDVVDENPDIVPGYDVMMASAEYDGAQTEGGVMFAIKREDGLHGPFQSREDAEKYATEHFADGEGEVFEMAEVIADAPEDDEDVEGDDEDAFGDEIPIHGVLAPEGVETGDGRGFRAGALSTRPLPMPYRYEYASTHGGTTSDVATVGRIDEAWLDEASGHFRFRGALIMTKPYADQALESIIDGSGPGLSIDADAISIDMESQTEEAWELAQAEGKMPTQWYTRTRISAVTQVPIPAFVEAYVALGHDFEEDLTDEQRAANAEALAACGCTDGDDEFRDVSTDERKRLADKGAAMPDGSYPIANCEDLRNAIQAIGRAKDPDATKAHIRRRKSALGCDDVDLPEDWSAEIEAFAPGTHDGPGWITNPRATARIRRYWVRGEGAAKIRWGVGGDFNRCRRLLAKYVQNPEWLAGLCANMHKEALGFWPATHAKKSAHSLAASGSAPVDFIRLVASGGTVYPSSAFDPPKEGRAFAMQIDRETRTIRGYAAKWGECHIGIQGMCREAPRSSSDYRYYRKGIVQTDAGEQEVGLITYGIGHAGDMASAAAATAHYDQTDAVRAYINIGEDEYGIWYAGVLAPWVTDDDIDAMLAIRRVSGDWRNWSGRPYDLEMVGLVVVNTEGFQLAASGGVQTMATGLGMVEPDDADFLAASGETHQQFVQRVSAEVLTLIVQRDQEKALRMRADRIREADLRSRARERV